MKTAYENPMITLVELDHVDIITASSDDDLVQAPSDWFGLVE